MKIKDFPKLESPFEREETEQGYICVPKFKREFSWILNPNEVIASEKLDGTNVSVYVEDGDIKAVFNRTNRIDIWKSQKHFYLGVKRAIEEKKFKPERYTDGQYFGELCGEKINKNPLELDTPLWIPFEYCKRDLSFRFYYDWIKEKGLNENSTDQELYDAFRELFINLKSLWFRKRGKEKQPEGIVFHNRKTGEMCKLRVDMWDFHKSGRHKQNENRI